MSSVLIKRFYIILGVICGCLEFALAGPRIDAYSLGDDEVILDGRLSESVWTKAKPASGMTERQPQPGKKAPIDFEFRVLYDEDSLYFGIESSLQPGEEPRSFELRRDTYKIWSDDAITIKIDVHQDKTTTIGFAFNAAGAQTDYIAIMNAGGFRREYDAVWESVSTWDEGRWVAEVRIPFSALGLPESSSVRTLGLNVTRDHNRRLATYDWSALPPELGPIAATHYGELKGLKHTGEGGTPLRMIPYFLTRTEDGDGRFGADFDVQSGLDLRLRLSQNLWGEFTAFTDFAEVDLDDALINLTRFPLFLPEKRPFFLSGIDVFSFGDSGAYQLFYSRRIGLDDAGNAIPLIGGAKVHGRIGRLGVGVLTVSTDEQGDIERRQYSVLRLRQDLKGRGNLGVLVVNRVALKAEASNITHTAVGVDGLYRLMDNRLQLSGYTALTMNREFTGPEVAENGCSRHDDVQETNRTLNTVAGGTNRLRARYIGPALESDTQLRHVGCDFDPKVGFASRTDVSSASQATRYVWRGLKGAVTQTSIGHEANLTLDGNGERYLGLETVGEFRLVLFNRLAAEVTGGYVEDVVDTGFTLPNGRDVPADTYTGGSYSASLSASEARNPYGRITYTYDDAFYGGVSHGTNASLGGAFGPHVRLSVRLAHNWLMFDDAPTDQTTSFNGDFNFAVNPRLFADVSLQANTVQESGRFLARLRWRYLPGSDVYVVYQDQLNIDFGALTESISAIESQQRSLIVKLTYWFDKSL